MLPEGLHYCSVCGEVRGTTRQGEESVCLCRGVTCRYCRAGRTRRPVSDHFEPDEGRWWHTPYFGQGIPCRSCRAMAPAATSWPGPLRDDPGIVVQLDLIAEAGSSLAGGAVAHQTAWLGARAGLFALHLGPPQWTVLGLGEQGFERPVQVGVLDPGEDPGAAWGRALGTLVNRSDATIGSPLLRRRLEESLRVSHWTPKGDVDPAWLAHALRMRWLLANDGGGT